MTRNRFKQGKKTSANILSTTKARKFFLEYTDYIDMKDTYKITSSADKMDISIKNITQF